MFVWAMNAEQIVRQNFAESPVLGAVYFFPTACEALDFRTASNS
jgi:hypothetical protein